MKIFYAGGEGHFKDISRPLLKAKRPINILFSYYNMGSNKEKRIAKFDSMLNQLKKGVKVEHKKD